MNKPSTVVRASSLTFGYVHARPILDEVEFSIKESSKITIMGQNGSGKSTLIKLIHGSLKPLAGSISTGIGLQIGYAQQVLLPEQRRLSVIEYFKSRLPDHDRTLEHKVAQILKEVKLNAPFNREVQSFSGGEQARILLAGTIIQNPDILLLDEPTNNLDVPGLDYLTEYILGFTKTLIVVSHDENFLNSFTDGVLYLDNHTHRVEQHNGDYNDVKRHIADRMAKEQAENARLAKLVQQKKEQAGSFANKGGNMRKVAKKMRETAEQMEQEKVEVRREDKSLRPFEIPVQKDLSSSKVLHIHAVPLPMKNTNHYNHNNDKPKWVKLFAPVVVEKRTRMYLRGPNGSGKTSFLESIVSGRAEGFRLSEGVRVGYYQQALTLLEPDVTVLDSLTDACQGSVSESGGEQYARKVAASFLLTRDQVQQRVGSLSEGQKGLLTFARLVLMEPGLLILDEPTNHINFRHLPAIASAVKSFQGALIVVSHDRQFVRNIDFDLELDLANLIT